MSVKTRKSVGRPKNLDSEETRRNILMAARECFARNGYRWTTNQAIAMRAGVTEGAIFYHFRTKKNLFLTANEELSKQIFVQFKDAIKGQPSFKEAFRSYGEAAFAITQSHPDWPRFLASVQTEAARNPEIEEALYRDKWSALINELIDLGVNAGEIDEGDRNKIFAVLMSINLGLGQYASYASGKPHKDAIMGFIDLFDGELVKN